MVTVRIGDDTIQLTWEQWEERVRSGRIPEEALVRFEAVTGDRFMPARRLEMYRSLRNESRIAWEGAFKAGPPPVVTALLVGAQTRLYWLAWNPEVELLLTLYFTNWTAPALEDGQVWRLLSMGFTHTDTFHLLLNMLWLAYTGWNLERALGWRNLLVLYLTSVVGGSLLSMYGSAATRSLGASGGVFGLVAASVAFGFARPDMLPERGRRVFGWAMLPYLVVMFWSGLRNDGTDNWSHFGGLVVGGLLVLLLDPEPLERRPGWNRRVRIGAYGLFGAILLGLGIAGPRAYLVQDDVTARLEHLERTTRTKPQMPDAYRTVEYSVPIGWSPGTMTSGQHGWTSPSPFGRRGWSVQEHHRDRPRTPDEVRASWTERLLMAAPDAAVGPLTPTDVAGTAGWQTTVTLDAEGTRSLQWRFAVRGLFELHEIWEIDRARAATLQPLAERLRASIRWNEPEALVLARDGSARRPGRFSERLALAEALAEWGELEQAREQLAPLLADRPDDPSVIRLLLTMIRWYPDTFESPLAEVERILARRSDPKVIRDITDTLDALGERDLAIGLLEIAWSQRPGDSALRKARRSLGLPSRSGSLSGSPLLPWHVRFDPATGSARTPEEIAALQARPVTLEGARTAHARWQQEQEGLERRLLDALADPAGDLTDPLLVMKYGYVPEGRNKALEGILRELASPDGPSDWPKAVREAWTDAATTRLETLVHDEDEPAAGAPPDEP